MIRPGLPMELTIVGAVAMAAVAFAVWPVRPRGVTVPTIERAAPERQTVAALDLAAFRTPIWVAEQPPPPPAPAPASSPPQPLKLQLLAIIRETEGYRAAVYDPDSDRVLVVAAGEKLGLRTVEQVSQNALTLRDHTGKRVLALKDGGVP